MDDASLQAGVLAQTKAYTAARERQTTRQLASWAQETHKDMGYWNDGKFTGIAGGVNWLQFDWPLVAHLMLFAKS